MPSHLYTAQVEALVREARAAAVLAATDDGRVWRHHVPRRAGAGRGDERGAQPRADGRRTRGDAAQRAHPAATLVCRTAIPHVFNRGIALPLAPLEDSYAAILGYDGIGREIARRLKAFGARVTAIERSARADDIADQVVASTDLPAIPNGQS